MSRKSKKTDDAVEAEYLSKAAERKARVTTLDKDLAAIRMRVLSGCQDLKEFYTFSAIQGLGNALPPFASLSEPYVMDLIGYLVRLLPEIRRAAMEPTLLEMVRDAELGPRQIEEKEQKRKSSQRAYKAKARIRGHHAKAAR